MRRYSRARRGVRAAANPWFIDVVEDWWLGLSLSTKVFWLVFALLSAAAVAALIWALS